MYRCKEQLVITLRRDTALLKVPLFRIEMAFSPKIRLMNKGTLNRVFKSDLKQVDLEETYVDPYQGSWIV